MIVLTVGLYAVGLAYYVFWSRTTIQQAAPEELAARHGLAAEKEVSP